MPSISLIATVLNEAKRLDEWLEAIRALELRPSEMVVVDGGSSDGTFELLAAQAGDFPFPVRVTSAPGVNISEGRNEATRLAIGEWIAVVDAGAIPEPSWLGALAARMRPDVDVVGGFFSPMYHGGLPEHLGVLLTPTLDEIKADAFLPSSRSLAYRKEAWAEVGGYPEWLDYCEDLVFDMALKEQGAAFEFAPDAIVSWEARDSVRSFAKQYYRYARGDGKAALWPRRHALRYAAYAAWVVSVPAAMRLASPVPLLLSGASAGLYGVRYGRRAWNRRDALTSPVTTAFAAAPLIIIGDVAKMIGYPVGVWHRMTRARGEE